MSTIIILYVNSMSSVLFVYVNLIMFNYFFLLAIDESDEEMGEVFWSGPRMFE